MLSKIAKTDSFIFCYKWSSTRRIQLIGRIPVQLDFDPNKALLSSLELEKKSIVLISINDNDSIEAGGSHWSLLAWVKSKKKFYHFDSWGNAPSKSAALQTANKISAAIGSPMPVDIRIVSFDDDQGFLEAKDDDHQDLDHAPTFSSCDFNLMASIFSHYR